jgi:hypothetical protein
MARLALIGAVDAACYENDTFRRAAPAFQPGAF